MVLVWAKYLECFVRSLDTGYTRTWPFVCHFGKYLCAVYFQVLKILSETDKDKEKQRQKTSRDEKKTKPKHWEAKWRRNRKEQQTFQTQFGKLPQINYLERRAVLIIVALSVNLISIGLGRRSPTPDYGKRKDLLWKRHAARGRCSPRFQNA